MAKNHSVEVMLLNVRLRYFYGAKPFEGKDDDGNVKYNHSLVALFPPGSPNHTAMKDAIRKAAVSGWPNAADAILQQLAAQDRLCVHNGDLSRADKIAAGDESWKGMLYVSANSAAKGPNDSLVCVATKNGVNTYVGPEDPLYPYAGCWANVKLRVYPQHPDDRPVAKNGKSYGKRVNAELLTAQLVRHDEAYSGGSKVVPAEEFPTVETAGADAAPPAAAAGGASLI